MTVICLGLYDKLALALFQVFHHDPLEDMYLIFLEVYFHKTSTGDI